MEEGGHWGRIIRDSLRQAQGKLLSLVEALRLHSPYGTDRTDWKSLEILKAFNVPLA